MIIQLKNDDNNNNNNNRKLDMNIKCLNIERIKKKMKMSYNKVIHNSSFIELSFIFFLINFFLLLFSGVCRVFFFFQNYIH
jgi:predicted type IV restriction endonuclease